jgi:Zn/Cd-binding protein ZinT
MPKMPTKPKDYPNCPHCHASLEDNALAYIEDGCTNYFNYSFNGKEWTLTCETNGDNPAKCYFACRNCGEKLPQYYQDYFSNIIC